MILLLLYRKLPSIFCLAKALKATFIAVILFSHSWSVYCCWADSLHYSYLPWYNLYKWNFIINTTVWVLFAEGHNYRLSCKLLMYTDVLLLVLYFDLRPGPKMLFQGNTPEGSDTFQWPVIERDRVGGLRLMIWDKVKVPLCH